MPTTPVTSPSANAPTTLMMAVTMIFVVLVWVFAGEDGALSRLLDHRALVTLGRWSFAIYMVHMFILTVMLIVGRKLDWLPNGLVECVAMVVDFSPILSPYLFELVRVISTGRSWPGGAARLRLFSSSKQAFA